MTDSATNAPTSDSSAAVGVIQRLEAFRIANPEATEYLVTTELDAAVLLLYTAAALQKMLPSVKEPDDQKAVRSMANLYRKSVNDGDALKLITDMDAGTQLEIYELKIVSSPTIKH